MAEIINLQFVMQQVDQFVHLGGRVVFLTLFDFDELDAEFWENDLADVEVELILEQYIKIAQVAGIVCVYCYRLCHALQILLDAGGHAL